MKLSPFPKETYERNADIYKVLANSKRLEILNILKKGELSVEELTHELGVRKANISQHLAILRLNRLVRVRRDGQRIFYSITDPRIVEPCRILHELWQKNALAGSAG
ncbi:winged helix-turn-helix transcriptional regulator [Candidatus Woesebacteria bacterium]|nr:winged helix-turn-helix transcriptional regulator [Candidatus Woesebacteria bacterium]